MIAALRGTVSDKSVDRVVVDVGGVGYLVHVSLQTMAELPAVGERVELLCHTHVREEVLALYGFIEPSERQAFELLKGVSGVGPKLAMTVLSGLPVRELADAIVGAQTKRLTAIPGIGKKSAERLILELKDRFAAVSAAAGATGATVEEPASAAGGELVEALVSLGYKRPLAQRAIDAALAEVGEGQAAAPPEKVLRRALALIQEL